MEDVKFTVKILVSGEVIPPPQEVSAVFLIALKDNDIVAIRNYRGWDIPAGHVESGEGLLTALQREALEEASMKFKNAVPFAIVTSTSEDPKYQGKCMVGFATKDFTFEEFAPAPDSGAYVGLKISEKVPVESLIFFVPAMYDRTGYRVNFGPQFSEVIRQPKSWNNSDAWEVLEKFTGKLLVIGAGKDATVPHELTQKIYDSTTHAAKRELHFIGESSHQIARFLIDNPNELDKIVSLIMNFLQA